MIGAQGFDPASRPAELLDAALRGERRALARAITWIENRAPGIGEALAARGTHRATGPGRPHVVGITGPPGAGKSTLVDALVGALRAASHRVAVVAVDPSSPFTGGAILGDRIRMERHTGDDGVYVRSLSSRGHLGGLSSATSEVVDLLDAVGFERVVVETVGVGQSELGVMEVADTAVVVLTPESGDAVQAMKAGLLEIADVFVVNKADRPGADRLVRELERSIALDGERPGAWVPPVLAITATEGRGVDAMLAHAEAHLAWCAGAGRDRWASRRGDARVRLALDLVAEGARARALARLGELDLLGPLRAGKLSAHAAVGRLS